MTVLVFEMVENTAFYSGSLIVGIVRQPITRQQILDSSKLKEFADDNFTFDENGSKLSKGVENIVGKGEIARYEQFLLFQQCFQKACFPWASKGVIVWEWVNEFNPLLHMPILGSFISAAI